MFVIHYKGYFDIVMPVKKSMYLVYDNVAQYSGIATRQIVCTT